jgi:hypothetical protein
MRFEDMSWREEFNGIWACASLLHVLAAELSGIAARLASALRPGAICYMSFKLGDGERVVEGRRFTDHTEATLRTALAGSGVNVTEVWLSSDIRIARISELWLNANAIRDVEAS